MQLTADLMFHSTIVNLAVALGIGLLIGAERERRKGHGSSRAPAGIRTFAAASLAGAVSQLVGGTPVLAVVAGGVIVFAAIAYFRSRSDDPGLTTEIALVLTVLLGGLATEQPVLAAAAAVCLALLLAARTPLHHFVRSVLTETEVRDALTFAGATLVVLPILPNQPLAPFGAVNPRSIWIIVILVMAIGAAGHIAIRALGPRFGLPLAGLASGFISSTATIGAMGAKSKNTPGLLVAATAGAVLSTIATIVQMVVVLAVTSLSTLHALTIPLACAGLVAVIYGAISARRAYQETSRSEPDQGHAFHFKTAAIFAATLTAILILSAALQQWFGEAGAIAGAAIAGFVDTHSAAISMASLVASETMSADNAVFPILVGLSTNTISKIVVAWISGNRAFALRVIPGLILVILAAWGGALAHRLVTGA